MSLLTLQPAELKRAGGFAPVGIEEPDGFITVYEEPRADGLYVIGGDFAYGLQEGDRDAFVVFDREADPVREVGIAVGKFGEKADRILYAMHRYWSRAFICAERQVGMFSLRRLWDEYGVRDIYRPRREEKPGRRVIDSLGHPRTANDMLLWKLRAAVREKKIELRSEIIVDEMGRVIWSDKTYDSTGERSRDEDLRVKLVGGGSPDLTMATAYAWLGCEEVHRFERGPQLYAKGTLGDILGHNEEILREQAERTPVALSPRMKRRRMGRKRT